jgi:hypothetical protein
VVNVFISYRHHDSAGVAALLFAALQRHLGDDRVSLDADQITPGSDWRRQWIDRVDASAAMFAVIGPRWLTLADTSGRRRLDDPDDWVGRELAEARSHGVRVIPVLTDRAKLPTRSELPDTLGWLSECHPLRLGRREPASELAAIVAEAARLDSGVVEPDSGAISRQLVTTGATGSTRAPTRSTGGGADTLAADLRHLWVASGKPSLTEIAAKSALPRGTVDSYLTGRITYPRLPALIAFIDALDIGQSEELRLVDLWRHVLDRTADEQRRADSDEPDTGPSSEISDKSVQGVGGESVPIPVPTRADDESAGRGRSETSGAGQAAGRSESLGRRCGWFRRGLLDGAGRVLDLSASAFAARRTRSVEELTARAERVRERAATIGHTDGERHETG